MLAVRSSTYPDASIRENSLIDSMVRHLERSQVKISADSFSEYFAAQSTTTQQKEKSILGKSAKDVKDLEAICRLPCMHAHQLP